MLDLIENDVQLMMHIANMFVHGQRQCRCPIQGCFERRNMLCRCFKRAYRSIKFFRQDIHLRRGKQRHCLLQGIQCSLQAQVSLLNGENLALTLGGCCHVLGSGCGGLSLSHLRPASRGSMVLLQCLRDQSVFKYGRPRGWICRCCTLWLNSCLAVAQVAEHIALRQAFPDRCQRNTLIVCHPVVSLCGRITGLVQRDGFPGIGEAGGARCPVGCICLVEHTCAIIIHTLHRCRVEGHFQALPIGVMQDE